MASANEILSTPMFMEGQERGDLYDTVDMAGHGPSQAAYDYLPDTPKCKCCPYGYHVDVGFVQYAEDAKRGKYLRHLQQIQRYKRRLRQTMEVFYKEHGRYPPMLNPPDLIRVSDGDSESSVRVASAVEDPAGTDEDTFALYGTTERFAKMKAPVHSDMHLERSRHVRGGVGGGLVREHTRSGDLSSSSAASSTTREISHRVAAAAHHSPPHHLRPEHCEVCHRRVAMSHGVGAIGCAQCLHGGSVSVVGEAPCELCECYVCPQCAGPPLTASVSEVAHTMEREESSTHITKEQLKKIREQMARSLARLRELEEKAKDVPVLEARISVLHEEKRLLEMQVEAKEQEKEDVERLYEESKSTVMHLQTLRQQDEINFAERLANLEESTVLIETRHETAAPRASMVDRGTGGGDVRQIYYLQTTTDMIADAYYDFDLSPEVLFILQSRWEASYKRAKAEEVGVMRSMGVVAAPQVRTIGTGPSRNRTADACQNVDMDEEDYDVADGGPDFAWYQEQASTSREKRSIIQSLRRAYQFNHVEFKNMIVRLLAKNVRSQAIQVLPDCRQAAVLTDNLWTRSVGVSEDHIDVQVRPFVQQYSIGVEVRASTANKMAFTDRVFRYEAATNTAVVQRAHAWTLTEQHHAATFSSPTQTEYSCRDKAVLTEPVGLVDPEAMWSKGVMTDRTAQFTVGVGADLVRLRDRSMATEARRMYETAVTTDPVLEQSAVRTAAVTVERNATSAEADEDETNGDYDVISDSMAAVSAAVTAAAGDAAERLSQDSGSTPEEVVTESWEEYAVMDTAGKVVHQQVTPITSHTERISRTAKSGGTVGITVGTGSVTTTTSQVTESSNSGAAAASSAERRSASTTRVERSRSGGEFSVTTTGAYEYGGGTVRAGQTSSGTASGDASWSFSRVEDGSRSLKVRHSSEHSSRVAEQREASTLEPSSSRSRTKASRSHAKATAAADAARELLSEPATGTGRQGGVESPLSRGLKVDVKTTDLYAGCKTLAQWLRDSTTTSSKQMNDAEANIKQAWFRLAGSRASRPEVVEHYINTIRELGNTIVEKLVNMADDNGNTCLHYAVSQANWPMVSLLLRVCSADVDRLNRTGYSPLMLASLCDLPIHDYPHLALRLARASNNVDQPSSSGAGQTALMLAASHGRLAMVEALLTAGASPNIKDKEGSTALMCASEHGHIEVVRALLARPDTDATCMDGEGSSALSIAMENNHRDVALLIYARTNLARSSRMKNRKRVKEEHFWT